MHRRLTSWMTSSKLPTIRKASFLDSIAAHHLSLPLLSIKLKGNGGGAWGCNTWRSPRCRRLVVDVVLRLIYEYRSSVFRILSQTLFNLQTNSYSAICGIEPIDQQTISKHEDVIAFTAPTPPSTSSWMSDLRLEVCLEKIKYTHLYCQKT